MKRRKHLLLLTVLFLLTALMLPVSVSAASKKYVKLYRNLLKKGTGTITSGTYTYSVEYKAFMTLDINRDGIPELLIKDQAPETGMTNIMVYTVKKGKLFYCGDYYTRTNYGGKISYSKKYKGVLDSWWTNGVGGSGVVLYGVSTKKHELVQKRWAWEGADGLGSTTMVYEITRNQKRVSKAKYDKYVNKYFNEKNFKTKKFKANTLKNRKKIK